MLWLSANDVNTYTMATCCVFVCRGMSAWEDALVFVITNVL
jgi:hypothetical protein